MSRSLYPRLAGSISANSAAPAAGLETVIATMSGVGTVNAEDVIVFEWNIAVGAVGTTGAALRSRVRRSSLTGTVVADDLGDYHGVTAGQPFVIGWSGQDQPGEVASLTYVLTLQTIGGTAGTTIDAMYWNAIIW